MSRRIKPPLTIKQLNAFELLIVDQLRLELRICDINEEEVPTPEGKRLVEELRANARLKSDIWFDIIDLMRRKERIKRLKGTTERLAVELAKQQRSHRTARGITITALRMKLRDRSGGQVPRQRWYDANAKTETGDSTMATIPTREACGRRILAIFGLKQRHPMETLLLGVLQPAFIAAGSRAVDFGPAVQWLEDRGWIGVRGKDTVPSYFLTEAGFAEI
jgi:hypothetical protein